MFAKIHLWMNQNYALIKHWLVIIVGVTLLVFSLIVIAGQNKLIDQVKQLAEQNKSLSEDNKNLNKQSTQLGIENQSIAKQNRSYTTCIAQIFAKYTRDGVAVENLNLDTCTTASQTGATNNTATGGTTPLSTSGNTSVETPSASPSLSKVVDPSSSNNTTTPPPSQSDTSQPPALPNCKVDILFVHLGC